VIGVFLFLISMAHAELDHVRVPIRWVGQMSVIRADLIGLSVGVTMQFAIDLNREKSVIDRTQVRELGVRLKKGEPFVAEVKIAQKSFGTFTFDTRHVELASLPEEPTSCCAGILGRDVLGHSLVVVDPDEPSHVIITPKASQAPLKPRAWSGFPFLSTGLKKFRYRGKWYQRRIQTMELEAWSGIVRVLKGKLGPEVAVLRAAPSFELQAPRRDVRWLSGLTHEQRKTLERSGIRPGFYLQEFQGKDARRVSATELKWLLSTKPETLFKSAWSEKKGAPEELWIRPHQSHE
jgi:hypothetical protein